MRLRFLAVLLTVIALPLFVSFRKVANFSCLNNSLSCDNMLIEKLDVDFRNYTLLPFYLHLRSVLNELRYVQYYSINVENDSDVVLNLTSFEPKLKYVFPKGDKIYTDENGREAAPTSQGVPEIYVLEKIEPEEMKFASNLYSKLTKLLEVDRSEIRSGSLFVKGKSIDLQYPLKGDYELLLGKTLLVFSQLNAKGSDRRIKSEFSEYKLVDFRFDDPILRK